MKKRCEIRRQKAKEHKKGASRICNIKKMKKICDIKKNENGKGEVKKYRRQSRIISG